MSVDERPESVKGGRRKKGGDARIINLVAVRMKSSRLPGKALLEIAGKPVLGHLMERVERAEMPFKTVICTSTVEQDDKLAEFAANRGYSLFRGHPDNVLARFIDAARMYGARHVVRITGDNPLTDPKLIDAMCKKHLEESADYTYTESTPRGTRPEIMSLAALEKCLKAADNPDHSEYMTLYFKNYPEAFKNVRFDDPDPVRNRPDYRLTIDTPDDFTVMQDIYERFYHEDERFSLERVIEYLDSRPEIPHASRLIPSAGSDAINTKLNLD